jgi:hypothetical protein
MSDFQKFTWPKWPGEKGQAKVARPKWPPLVLRTDPSGLTPLSASISRTTALVIQVAFEFLQVVVQETLDPSSGHLAKLVL